MKYANLFQKLTLFYLAIVVMFAGSGMRVAAQSAGSWPEIDSIQASAYIVADLESGDIIFSYQPDDLIYPASTTKIMTALLLIESDRLDEIMIVSEMAADLDYDMAKVGFLPGEEVVLEDVLYSLMLSSGNDAARVAAEALGGSISGFAALMTEKAGQLGMQDTVFVNPSGLHHPDHVTTATDMLKLTQYAMNNEVFRDVVMTEQYTMPTTNLHPFNAWAVMQNSNNLLRFGDLAYQSDFYRAYTGIKTGTTRAAGFCLAASARTYDDREIAVLLFGVPYYVPRATLYQYTFTLFQEAAEKLSLPAKHEGAPDGDEPDQADDHDDNDGEHTRTEPADEKPVSDETSADQNHADDSDRMTETTSDLDQNGSQRDPAGDELEAEMINGWRRAFIVLASVFTVSLALAIWIFTRMKA